MADFGSLAILGAQGEILYATPIAMRLFGAANRAELQRALGLGDGPNARRLRHLAATLPLGGPPRLERIRYSLGRRSVSLNLLCARVPADGDKSALVLSTADFDKSIDDPVATPASSPAFAADPTLAHGKASRGARFLWTLNSEGRFGPTDSFLEQALGDIAPRPGETLEQLLHRAEIENADEFAALIEKRETFAGLPLMWRTGGEHRKLGIILSAAPVFDSHRVFAGYRGFGILNEAIGDVVGRAEPVGRAHGAAGDGPESTVKPQESPLYEDEPGGMVPSGTEAPAPPSFGADDEVDGEEFAPGLPESEDAGKPPTGASQERTAEIYFLRQASGPAKVVPIRPGASDAHALHQPQGDSESVELSRSERDAFREIARALVGRPPTFHTDPEVEPAGAEAGTDGELNEEPHDPVTGPDLPPDTAGLKGADARNALRLLDRLPVGVLVARDARALYLNRTLLDLLGYRDLEHFELSDALAMMFGGDAQSLSEEDHGALTIVKADGGALAVEGHAQVVAWDGAPGTLFSLWPSPDAERGGKRGHGRDEAQAPAGSADDLQKMLDLATDGAAILDPAGRILSVNLPTQRMFGYGQSDVAGESVLMLLAPQSHPDATAALDRLSRAGETAEPNRSLPVTGRRRDGQTLTLELTLARIGPPDAFSYCALMRDAGREREAEARLVAARDAALATSAAKTDFLAQVSHEIRTPLSAILGFAEVMMEERFGPVGNDRYRDYLKDIHASGNHVMSLADDLLDLSKIESGKLDLEFALVDANSVIRECVSLMQPQAARERVILRVSLFERLPRVMVDERSLKQVMLNLMSNAVKFNEPGGQVIISTAVDAGGQAVIRVRDTGMGMSESEVGVALAPFGRIGRSDRKGGAGLGLPLTKALVEANKAEFSIKSRREQGTLIEIAFPVIQAAQ